jgi:predicted  nucleic acid-binding Zn-ribbon protein
MPEKYGFSGWVWILAAVVLVGFLAVGSYLVQTQQRLKAVGIELGRAEEKTVRAKAGATELAKVAENLRLELQEANAARNEYQGKLDKANAAIAELSKKLDTAQSDLGKRHSQLQAMEAELMDAKQAADQAKAEAAENEKQIVRLKEEVALERQAIQSQVEGLNQTANQAKAEAAEREKQIAKLRQGIASCEEFFNEWEVRGAPASISAIAALGREAAAAKDCIDKGDVATACKHWQSLLVEIEKMGTPLSESRGDIEELMRQNRCEAEGNSTSKSDH